MGAAFTVNLSFYARRDSAYRAVPLRAGVRPRSGAVFCFLPIARTGEKLYGFIHQAAHIPGFHACFMLD